MTVIYKGRKYTVRRTNFLGNKFFGLESRFSGGSVFPALKTDCRVL